MFENIVDGIDSFSWGHRLPNDFDRAVESANQSFGSLDVHRYNRIYMHVPNAMAATVSLLIEVFASTLEQRSKGFPQYGEKADTFSLAVFEVLDGKVGRIKLLDQVVFYDSALGFGSVPPSGKTDAWQLQAGAGLHDQTERLCIVGCQRVATAEIRKQLQDSLEKTAKHKPKPAK